MHANTAIIEFSKSVNDSLKNEEFVKISLGNYLGSEKDLKNVYVRRIVVKRISMLSFTYRYKTKDIVKNHSILDGGRLIVELIESGFRISTLFKKTSEIQYELLANGKSVLRARELSTSIAASGTHDKVKVRPIAAEGKGYLYALGITNDKGEVIKASQDKYKQINHYIDLLRPLIKEVSPEHLCKVVDMGSGKGYLTFALYDYLHHLTGATTDVIGVEFREDLVALCNDIAAKSGFNKLQFVKGSIAEYETSKVDLLIALHACDTATDDAIFKGIEAEASLIVVAPCCHKQIRREMETGKTENIFSPIIRHGIFMERQAEMITDALRALYLEYAGYRVKVMQFISDEHTPKNVMITGIRHKHSNMSQKKAIIAKIDGIKKEFGIVNHHLGQLMGL